MRPDPPVWYPGPMWDELNEFVDRGLEALFPNGAPPHSDDCPDHDRCITLVLIEDVWDHRGDTVLRDLVYPLVAYWVARRQAGEN